MLQLYLSMPTQSREHATLIHYCKLLQLPRRLAASSYQPPGNLIHNHTGEDHAADDRELDLLVLRMDQIDGVVQGDHHGRSDDHPNDTSLAAAKRAAAEYRRG